MWYVYLLECRGGRYYIGATNDVNKRMKAHVSGKGSKFTWAFRPCKLVGFKEYDTKIAALKDEYRLKRLKKENKRKEFVNVGKRDG